MRDTQRRWSTARVPGWALCLTLTAAPAAGQESSGATQSSSPAVRIEQMSNGWVLAPDVKLTEIDGRSATLAGVYGGVVVERMLLFGAAGYWLVSAHDDFKMAYGGGVVEWIVRGERRISFGARALVGAGEATLSNTFAELSQETHVMRFGRSRGANGLSPQTPVVVRSHFFVAEPQANAALRITDWLRINGGLSYRIIAGSDFLDDRLRGLSGSVSLALGR